MKLRLIMLLNVCFISHYSFTANLKEETPANSAHDLTPIAPAHATEQKSSPANSAHPVPAWALGLLFPRASTHRELYQAIKATGDPDLLKGDLDLFKGDLDLL